MKKTIISIIFISLILGSCSKDWLELEPQGQRFENNFYKTDKDAEQGLIAAYAVLKWKYYDTWSSYYLLANLPSDDTRCGGENRNDQPEYHDVNEFIHTPTNQPILKLWRRGFFGIYRANVVIDRVPEDNDYKKQVKAEAKFLRAYYYFELAKFFGDLPLITAPLAPSEYYQERKPVKEIFAQVEKDLLEAIPLLAKKSELSTENLYRASKEAAQALLGRVYLFMASPYYNLGNEYYSKAADQLAEVVNSGAFQLESNYDDIWKANTEHGKESLFEIEYSYVAALNGFGAALAEIASGNIDVQLTGYRGGNPGRAMFSGWGFDQPTQSLVDAYKSENDTSRLNATIYSNEWIVEQGGKVANVEQTGFWSKKRACWRSIAQKAVIEWTYGTNERMIRYGDVLLMYAEALNRKAGPDDAKALAMVNQVRSRALIPAIIASGDALFQAIKKERRLELAMEGYRWFDLVRWGDAGSVLAPLGFKQGTHEKFPIPQEEIVNSNNKMVQNAGY